MTILHPQRYLTDQSLEASFVGPTIDTRMLDNLSFTLEWGAVAGTDGDIYLETTDDPRAETDQIRGTSTATWIKRTLSSFDGSNVAAAGDDKGITIDANAGNVTINFADLHAFARLGYTRRGGGGAAQMQGYVSGNSYG
jgi:hypothetical protein